MNDFELDDVVPGRVSSRTLRSFAALCVAIPGLLFCVSWYRNAGTPTAAGWTALAIALLVGLPGLFRPEFARPVFVVATAVTQPVGRVMNVLLVGALYYGVVTPIALMFRLSGRDVLRRRRPTASTYWVPRGHTTDVTRYLRQYQRQ